MRPRAKPTPATDGLVYPPELRNRSDPRWWTPPTAEDLDWGESFARCNPSGTVEQGVASARASRAFRVFADARKAWAIEHGLVDEHGRVDWHQLGPIIRNAGPDHS